MICSATWSASVTRSKRPLASARTPAVNRSARRAPDSRATSTAMSRWVLCTRAVTERETPDQAKRRIDLRLHEQTNGVDRQWGEAMCGRKHAQRLAHVVRLGALETGRKRHVKAPLIEHVRIAPLREQRPM